MADTWFRIKDVKDRIMALPRDEQGPLIEELSLISDRLFGLDISLDDLESTLIGVEAQKLTMVQCSRCRRVFQTNEVKVQALVNGGRAIDQKNLICSSCTNIPSPKTQIYYMEATL